LEDYGGALGIAAGRAYVTGITRSPDFPTTPGAFDTSFNGGQTRDEDVFVTKLNSAGSALDYSTYLGGSTSDDSDGLAVADQSRKYEASLARGSPTANVRFECELEEAERQARK
jgi:hypothetical protein